MKTDVIYEPKGKALEYSPLALNLFDGCPHGCTYCYAPLARHIDRKRFHDSVTPRKNIIERIRKDCAKLKDAGEDRKILMCFTCDPYPNNRPDLHKITREALEVLAEHGMKVAVLTKGGKAVLGDLPLFMMNGWSLGVTLVYGDSDKAAECEPLAAQPAERMATIIKAHNAGIDTFVSLEPVIDPAAAITIIKTIKSHVNLWKIGPLNYNKAAIDGVDWRSFVDDIRKELPPERYYLKKELLVKAGEDGNNAVAPA